MSTLMQQVAARAEANYVPLSAHLDLTWRCNEKCVHCYLEHASPGEMDPGEIRRLLDQLASAGTLFLGLSGGEMFLRPDALQVIAYARELLFSVTVKTNGVLLGEREAEVLAHLAVDQVNISVYSHRPEVHDSITRLPGSFSRSIAAVKTLVRCGVRTRLMHVLMQANLGDYPHVRSLAAELGAEARFDPTVTPAMNGCAAPAALRIPLAELGKFVHDPDVIEDVARFCAPPHPADDETLDAFPCGAGLRNCYISPVGEVTPCVALPLVCGNVRQQSFIDIWRGSAQFRRVREIHKRHLPVCSACANLACCNRCPGLAYRGGDELGPSLLDCEKTYARTGVPTPLVPAPEPARC